MPQFRVKGRAVQAVTRECDRLAHRFGNAADNPMRGRRYPTDVTDEEWAVVRPLLPVPGWMRGRGGQPEAFCHRQILDAIRYLVDNGIKWRAMPADFPTWYRAYAFFRRWRDHGLVKADTVVGCDSRGFAGGKLINGRKRHVVVDPLGLLLG